MKGKEAYGSQGMLSGLPSVCSTAEELSHTQGNVRTSIYSYRTRATIPKVKDKGECRL